MTTDAEIEDISRKDDDIDTVESVERLECEGHDPNEKYGIYEKYGISNFSNFSNTMRK